MTIAIAPTGSEPVLVDSSGWLEYLTAGEKSESFAPYFEGAAPLLVPTVVIYEVLKILLLRTSKTEADLFISEALRREVVPLDESIAFAAASLAVRHKLAMADAIIFATAQVRRAELVTSDSHFAGLPGVILL